MATLPSCLQILKKLTRRDLFCFLLGAPCWLFAGGALVWIYFSSTAITDCDHATDALDILGKESVFNSSIEADFITNVKRHNESCRIQCTTEDLRWDVLGVEYDPPTGEYCKCPEISGCCVDPGHILKPTGNVTEYRVYKETGRNKTTRFVKMSFTNPSGCECRPKDD